MIDPTRRVTLRTALEPGDIGQVTSLHGLLYSREYGLDHTFEAYVAEELGAFVRAFDASKDRLWLAEAQGQVVGSVAVLGDSVETARLRWFLVHPDWRGIGLGRALLQGALDFCRERGCSSVYLWTISELETAARLYRAAGFVRTERKTHPLWGKVRTEERYDLKW